MSKEKRYDIIFWDVDGTLLDFLKSESFALKDCLTHFGLPVSDEIVKTYSGINEACWKKLERGEVDRPWVLRHRFEELFDYLHIRDVDVAAFQERYQQKLGSVFYFQDQGKELLMKLKADFKQYVVTNGVESTQRMKIEGSGMGTLLEDSFISEDIGFDKPDRRFFEACLDRIAKKEGRMPDLNRILIVGDSMTSDMEGGRRMGIDCCYYHKGSPFLVNGGKEGPTYTIGNLWEVEKILWQNHPTKN